MRVLLIEDDERLADNIANSLRESSGYAVDEDWKNEKVE